MADRTTSSSTKKDWRAGKYARKSTGGRAPSKNLAAREQREGSSPRPVVIISSDEEDTSTPAGTAFTSVSDVAAQSSTTIHHSSTVRSHAGESVTFHHYIAALYNQPYA